MRARSLWLVPAFCFIVAACSGDSGTASTGASYENIGGSYAGNMSGGNSGLTFNGTFGLTISQASGGLTGSYALQGTVSDGVNSVAAEGTGPFSGTIASGSNPSVNLTILAPGCPNYSAHFSGTYDSANHRVTLIGPVDLVNDSCVSVLSYQTTVVLTR